MVFDLSFAILLSLSWIGGVSVSRSLDDTSVSDDLSSVSGFSASDYPQAKAFEHAQSLHGDYRALTVVDGAESFSKLYVYLYHPSGVRGGYWDGSGYSDPGSYAFKISDSSDYSDYKKVTATFLSVSSDLLFWKFRVDYQFPFSASSERGYDLASFEILNPSASESNSYVLGERFLVSGSGGSTLVTHQTLDVMQLNVGVFAYCYSEKNSHTVDYYLDPGFGTASSSSCYTRLLCCAFHFPSSYGTLVGLRLSWAMQQYVLDPASSHAMQPYAHGEKKSYVLDYTDADRKVLSAGQTAVGSALSGIGINFPNFYGKAGDSVKVIEKVDLAKAIAGDSSLLIQDDGKAYFAAEGAKAPSDDYYVIRYDVRDMTVVSSSGVPSWLDVFGRLVVGPVFMSSIEKISTIFASDQKASSWETDDLSVISLTFNKEGKSYVIPVSSDSKRLVATWPSFAPDSGWPEWVKILLLFAGVFGGVYIVYRIVRWARGKARHGSK